MVRSTTTLRALCGAWCAAWVAWAPAAGSAQEPAPPDAPLVAPPVEEAETLAAPVAPVPVVRPETSESTADRSDTLRVAVLLVPTGDVDPATTDALTELLIAAVASRGSPQIVGKEELQALLHRDDEQMLECMESVTCLGIAGVELGVREIVSGTLGQRDGSWIFVLERMDVRTGQIAGRVFRVVEGELGTLIDALSDAVPELYVEAIRPGRIVLHTDVVGEVSLDGEVLGFTASGVPFRRDLVPPGVHELALRAPGHAPWSRTIEVEEGASLVLDAVPVPSVASFEMPGLTWAFGGAALLTLAGGIAVGYSSQGAIEPTATMREVFDFFDAREREAITADILFGVSGAFALAALVPLVMELVDGDRPTDLVVLPTFSLDPGGFARASVTVGGAF